MRAHATRAISCARGGAPPGAPGEPGVLDPRAGRPVAAGAHRERRLAGAAARQRAFGPGVEPAVHLRKGGLAGLDAEHLDERREQQRRRLLRRRVEVRPAPLGAGVRDPGLSRSAPGLARVARHPGERPTHHPRRIEGRGQPHGEARHQRLARLEAGRCGHRRQRRSVREQRHRLRGRHRHREQIVPAEVDRRRGLRRVLRGEVPAVSAAGRALDAQRGAQVEAAGEVAREGGHPWHTDVAGLGGLDHHQRARGPGPHLGEAGVPRRRRALLQPARREPGELRVARGEELGAVGRTRTRSRDASTPARRRRAPCRRRAPRGQPPPAPAHKPGRRSRRPPPLHSAS